MTKKKYNYFDNNKGSFHIWLATVSTIIGSSLIGAAGLGAGILLNETLPADSSYKNGSELATSQYDRLLEQLAEKKTILENIKDKVPDANNFISMPESLEHSKSIIDEETKQYRIAESNFKTLATAENNLNSLATSFYTNAMIDKRLSEEKIQTLFTKISEDIGDFKTLTGSEMPDFGDIDFCRNDIFDYYDDQHQAGKINSCSQELIGDKYSDPSGQIALLISFLSMSIGFSSSIRKEYKESKYYKGNQNKYNH